MEVTSSFKKKAGQLRLVAAQINLSVVKDGLSLEKALDGISTFSKRDAALLKALSYGAIRWHHRIQWQANRLLDRPLKNNDELISALIRVGLYQLQWMRIPDHAAVAETVSAAGLLGKPKFKGLVNAVLRRFLREQKILMSAMNKNEGAATSHSSWMRDRLKADWPDQWLDIVKVNNDPPPMWLRVNNKFSSRDDYLGRLEKSGIKAKAFDDLPNALLLKEPQPMSTLPCYYEGEVSVQDAGAQLACGFLNLEPGLKVLDACAAPGGKSAHILETCPEIGKLVALDQDKRRLTVMAEEFQRLDLSGNLIHSDAAMVSKWWDGVPFDRILVDAPCSALGIIRRHPDIKVLRRSADIGKFVAIQRRLLKALWPILAPGGRLVYSTCTIVKEENQYQKAWFLEKISMEKYQASSFRQILPGEGNMDGFYYAWVDKQH